MFDPLLYPMNDDWLDFAVGVASVGNVYIYIHIIMGNTVLYEIQLV